MVLARIFMVGVLALAIAGASHASIAASLAGLETANVSSPSASLVTKVHGFHCRKMLGWDPVAGVFRVHSHPGICANYKRCIRAQKRCVFVLGRGFEPWSYEAFGSDNDRYYACMIKAGCY
jgi:hypothetical protein